MESDLKKYKALAEKWLRRRVPRGLRVDLIDELEELSASVAKTIRVGVLRRRPAFTLPSLFTRLLHARTGEELQRRFRERGLPLIVMPIRV